MNKEILRRIRQVLLIVIVLGLLYYPFFNGDSTTKISKMDEVMTKKMNLDLVEKQDAKGLKRYFNVDVKDTDGFVFYHSKSMMDVDEVLIVRLLPRDDGEALVKAVEARLAKQQKNFDGYGTNQSDLLKHKELEIKKGYLFYAVSKHAGDWKQSFQDTL